MANVKTSVTTPYGKNTPGEFGQPGQIGPLAAMKMKIDPMAGELKVNRIKPGTPTNNIGGK